MPRAWEKCAHSFGPRGDTVCMGLFSCLGNNMVGCPEMDSDHRTMLEILDQLHEAMIQGRGGELILVTLDRLAEQESAHFGREERLMQECGYPDLERHRELHLEMLQELAVLRCRARAGHMPIAYDTMQTMRRWIAEHINGEDRSAAKYIMMHRPGDPLRGRTDKNPCGSVLMAGPEHGGLSRNGQVSPAGVAVTGAFT